MSLILAIALLVLAGLIAGTMWQIVELRARVAELEAIDEELDDELSKRRIMRDLDELRRRVSYHYRAAPEDRR